MLYKIILKYIFYYLYSSISSYDTSKIDKVYNCLQVEWKWINSDWEVKIVFEQKDITIFYTHL